MRRLILLLSIALSARAWPAGYSQFFAITINAGKVPSRQTNFTFLFAGNSLLRAAGNGGCATNSNGYDIIFAADSGGATLLNFETPPGTYSPSTGAGEWWIKVPGISSGTVIYGACGNATVSSFQGGAAGSAWDSGYTGVWHLSAGSPLSLADSSTLQNNLTNVGGATAASGVVDGAASLVAANAQYLNLPNASSVLGTAMTLSLWLKAATFPGAYNTVFSIDGSSGYFDLHLKNNGMLALYLMPNGGMVDYDGSGSHTLTPGSWYHVTMAYDPATGLAGYVNGSLDGTASANGNLASMASPQLSIGNNPPNFPWRYFDGTVDEPRVSKVARSADWIATEYNNQLSPASFYTFAQVSYSYSHAGRHRVIGN